MKRFILFLLVLVMLSAFNIPAFAEAEPDTVEMITFTVTDGNGSNISCVNDNEGKIVVNTIAVNRTTDEAGATLILGIYDADNNRMKAFFTSDRYTLPKHEKKTLSLSASLKGLNGIEEKDIIRVFFWDEISGMIQLRDNINAADTSDFANIYSTNNTTDFNDEINVISGDRWSYVGHGSVNTEEAFSFGLLKAFQGKWWLDPNKINTGANWYLEGNGMAMSEVKRGVGWNYTIGEYTENCNIVIEGSFTGASTTELYVFMSDFSSSSKVEITNPQEEHLLKTGVTNSFRIEIPAKQAAYGRNISFLPNWNQGGYNGNTLNVTITATPSKNVSVNSIKNFAEENAIGAGRWSYINAPAYSVANETLSYDGLLTKGDGEVYAENEYASDITNTDHTYYLNSLGEVYTDKDKMLGYVYTVGEEFDGAASITLKGQASCENSAFRIIAVKTSDGDSEVIGDSAALLYNQSASVHALSAELEPTELKLGDDIIFIIRTTSTNDWIPIKTDFTISAIFEE